MKSPPFQNSSNFGHTFFIQIFFEFQIATNARGRGVQRLLLLAQRINILGIPALAMLVFHAADPSESMSYVTCLLVRIVTIILETNRMLSEPTLALGRYVNLS